MDSFLIIAMLCIGLLTGVVGGLLGVGGSIVMIPAMTEVLGPDQHLYQAAAMIVNFFVVVPAVYQHRKAGAIDMATVWRLVPLALIAVVCGVAVSELAIFSGAGERYLRALFGAFLLLMVLRDLWSLVRNRQSNQNSQGSATAGPTMSNPGDGWRRAAAVAVPTGLVAGLFGIGGGVLAVPLQRRLLGIPIRNAIANSAAVIVATSVIGGSVKNYAVIVDGLDPYRAFVLAAVLIPTAILGSLLGSRLTHKLPVKAIKAGFLVLLAVAAIRMIWGAG
ncbi:MAG: sulfite exporter TauE/SafE family protein [Planctomycetes bacterium]|nr:sulfite exporter TauE/SafE family protein [Planctomycetota bacterium]